MFGGGTLIDVGTGKLSDLGTSMAAVSSAGSPKDSGVSNGSSQTPAEAASAAAKCKRLELVMTVKDAAGNDVPVYYDPDEEWAHTDPGPPPSIVLGTNDRGCAEAAVAHELHHINEHRDEWTKGLATPASEAEELEAKRIGLTRAEEIIARSNDPEERRRYEAYRDRLREEIRLQTNPTVAERIAMWWLSWSGESDNTPRSPRLPPCN